MQYYVCTVRGTVAYSVTIITRMHSFIHSFIHAFIQVHSRYSLSRHAAVIKWGALSLDSPIVMTTSVSYAHRHGRMINCDTSSCLQRVHHCQCRHVPRPCLGLVDYCKLHGWSHEYQTEAHSARTTVVEATRRTSRPAGTCSCWKSKSE